MPNLIEEDAEVGANVAEACSRIPGSRSFQLGKRISAKLAYRVFRDLGLDSKEILIGLIWSPKQGSLVVLTSRSIFQWSLWSSTEKKQVKDVAQISAWLELLVSIECGSVSERIVLSWNVAGETVAQSLQTTDWKPHEREGFSRLLANMANYARGQKPEAVATHPRSQKQWRRMVKRSRKAAELRDGVQEFFRISGNPHLTSTGRLTWILISACVAVYLFTWLPGVDADQILNDGACHSLAIALRGEWHRLLSSMFLHLGVLHLGLNMLALYYSGLFTEKLHGVRLTLFLWTASGIAAGLASLQGYWDEPVLMVGASGAVMGLIGAMGAYFVKLRRSLPKLFVRSVIRSVGLSTGLTFLLGGISWWFFPDWIRIDNYAHAGGFVTGWLLSWLLAPSAKSPTRAPSRLFSFSIVTLTCLALLVWGGWWSRAINADERFLVKAFLYEREVTGTAFVWTSRESHQLAKSIQDENPDWMADLTQTQQVGQTNLETLQSLRPIRHPALAQAAKELEQAQMEVLEALRILEKIQQDRLSLRDWSVRMQSASAHTVRYNQILDECANRVGVKLEPNASGSQ